MKPRRILAHRDYELIPDPPDPKDGEAPSPEAEEAEAAAVERDLAARQRKAFSDALEIEKSDSGAFRHIDHPRKRAFLVALALTGTRVRASDMSGVSRNLVYSPNWQADQDFQEGMKTAERMAADITEDEIHRRAVEGTVRPTGWHKGKPGGFVREYSDILLIFKAKGELPEKYKERMEFRGAVTNIDVSKLRDDQLERVRRGEHVLAVLASDPEVQRQLSAGQIVQNPDAIGAP